MMNNALLILSSKSNEWYTPTPYVEAARQLMSKIDLDPASCDEANRIVAALRYYTKKDNGLMQDWTCESMWLNPPYGKTIGQKANVANWVNRLLAEYARGSVKEAVLLVCNHTETQWFQPLWQYPICFTDHRINFYPKTSGGPTFGSVLVYFGTQEKKFTEVFSQFGRIVRAIDTPRQHHINLELWGGVA